MQDLLRSTDRFRCMDIRSSTAVRYTSFYRPETVRRLTSTVSHPHSTSRPSTPSLFHSHYFEKMYGQEETFARSFDKATPVCSAVAAVSLLTSLLFANSLCDMDLSEWHVVNAILCGSLAAAAHFATRVNPRAMQAGFRVYKAETSMRELMSEGLLSAAASVALVACPALLLFWSARGFASMGVGICAESAPMFFAISLSLMLAEAAALVYVIGRNLQAAGYSLEKLKHHGEMLMYKVKEIIADWSRNGYHYVMRAYENIVPTIKGLIHSLLEMLHRLWEQRPRWMNASYWAGSEGSYLLR